MVSPFRRLRPLARLAAAAAAFSFGACGGADSPLAPTDDAPVPPADPGQAEAATPDVAALTTTQRIAFISPRDGKLNLYKMDPSGNQVARLTNTTAQDHEPAWSYDNKRIAVVRYRLDGTVGHDDIWLVNADGTNGHWLRNTQSPWDLMDPSWAPDGSHLLVSLWLSPYWYLAKMDVATGTITLLHPYGGGIIGIRASYDHAGQRIIYVGATRLTVDQVSADGSGHKTRYTSSSGAVDHPSFSPDGKRIVFVRATRTPDLLGELWVCNADGSEARKLTDALTGYRVSWSPDGRWIAGSDAGDLLTFDLQHLAAEPLRITIPGGAASVPRWSPDSRRLVFEYRPIKTTVSLVYAVDADGLNFTQLTSGPDDESPDWGAPGF